MTNLPHTADPDDTAVTAVTDATAAADDDAGTGVGTSAFVAVDMRILALSPSARN